MSRERLIKELVKESNTNNPMQYVRNIVKDLDKECLNKSIMSCKKCNTYCHKKSIAYGNPNASLMIIGNNFDLDNFNKKISKPFSKRSFAYIETALKYHNLNYDDVFFINAVNCISVRMFNGQSKEVPPNTEQVTNCKDFSSHAIEFVQPDAIIIMGSIASNMYIKNSLNNIRGVWTSVKGIPTVVTYEPQYLDNLIQANIDMDKVKQKRFEFLEDIGMVAKYIKEKRPDSNLFK